MDNSTLRSPKLNPFSPHTKNTVKHYKLFSFWNTGIGSTFIGFKVFGLEFTIIITRLHTA
jgi:hypothetical protein